MATDIPDPTPLDLAILHIHLAATNADISKGVKRRLAMSAWLLFPLTLERRRKALYREGHREQRRASDRSFRHAHLERHRERCQKYREGHSEQRVASDRAYYEAHRAERMAQRRKWRAEHPEAAGARKHRKRVADPAPHGAAQLTCS